MRELLAQRTSWNSSFFEPWFCHIFFTILITWPNIKLNYSCLFMLLTLIIASYLVLRCMDYCQRFQKNVMRYAATLRDWNVTLYINFGDVNLTMFFVGFPCRMLLILCLRTVDFMQWKGHQIARWEKTPNTWPYLQNCQYNTFKNALISKKKLNFKNL